MQVYIAYQNIRDETFRARGDHEWEGTGRSQITLECEEFEGYDSDCDPFNYGYDDFARSSYRRENHLLLCPPFFQLNRHLPRNEVDDSKVTVLLDEMIQHFNFLAGPLWHVRDTYAAARQLTRFAVAIALRREIGPQLPAERPPEGFESSEDRLQHSDDENAMEHSSLQSEHTESTATLYEGSELGEDRPD
ncbi:MAG: hypothetical protein Q9160_004979 [Pyrenula sp. 1 TL-2023]